MEGIAQRTFSHLEGRHSTLGRGGVGVVGLEGQGEDNRNCGGTERTWRASG